MKLMLIFLSYNFILIIDGSGWWIIIYDYEYECSMISGERFYENVEQNNYLNYLVDCENCMFNVKTT